MTKTVKRLSLLLALIMTFSVLSACSPKEPIDTSPTDSANTAVREEDEFDPLLPEADFEGYTFVFAGRGEDGATTLNDATDIIAKGDEGDVVSEAIYKRNMEITQKYNFNIEVDFLGGVWGKLSGSPMNKAVGEFVSNNDEIYDAIISATQETIGFAMEGWTVDLNTVEHLDLEQSWWDQSVARDLALGSSVYMATGDIMTTDKRGVLCTIFNKKLASELNLEDHYKLVEDGKWTFETFYENAKKATSDMNGDNKMDENDRYGYVYWREQAMNTFIVGTGNSIGRTRLGMFEITADSESMQTVWQDMMSFLTGGDAYSIMYHDGEKAEAEMTRHFHESNMALYGSATVSTLTVIRGYTSDMGVLPGPKLDESQTDYITGVSPWGVNFISIPITNAKLERTGHILEAMAARGAKYIRPAFYEITLKSKSTTDYQSSSILDLLFETRYYDVGACFDWGKLADSILVLFDGNGTQLSSTVQSKKTAAQTDMAAQMLKFGMT